MFVNLEELYLRNNELIFIDSDKFKKEFLVKLKILKNLKVLEIRFNSFLKKHYLQNYDKIIKKEILKYCRNLRILDG